MGSKGSSAKALSHGLRSTWQLGGELRDGGTAGSGAPRKIGDEQVVAVIARTLEELPPGATHWSLRARVSGYAPSTIHLIWQAFGLQPHRS